MDERIERSERTVRDKALDIMKGFQGIKEIRETPIDKAERWDFEVTMTDGSKTFWEVKDRRDYDSLYAYDKGEMYNVEKVDAIDDGYYMVTFPDGGYRTYSHKDIREKARKETYVINYCTDHPERGKREVERYVFPPSLAIPEWSEILDDEEIAKRKREKEERMERLRMEIIGKFWNNTKKI